jgi:hypothetical protein
VLNQQEGQVRAHQWTAEEKAALRAEVKPKAATTMSITVPLQSGFMVPPVPDVVTGPRNAVAVGDMCLNSMSESVPDQLRIGGLAWIPAPRCTNIQTSSNIRRLYGRLIPSAAAT